MGTGEATCGQRSSRRAGCGFQHTTGSVRQAAQQQLRPQRRNPTREGADQRIYGKASQPGCALLLLLQRTAGCSTRNRSAWRALLVPCCCPWRLGPPMHACMYAHRWADQLCSCGAPSKHRDRRLFYLHNARTPPLRALSCSACACTDHIPAPHGPFQMLYMRSTRGSSVVSHHQ